MLAVESFGTVLGMRDVFGGPSALLGTGPGGGELNLYQLNGLLGIHIDADKSVYGNPNSTGGEIELRSGSGQIRVLLDGDFGGAGRIDVRNVAGQVGLLLDGHSNAGGRIQVRQASGPANVDLLGSGTGGGGEIRVLDAAGDTATVEILGAETGSTGSEIRLRKADGTLTVAIDAENDAQGGPRVDLYTGNGTSTMVFLPGGGDATLGGGGISQHGAMALGGAIGPIAPALSPAIGGNSTLTAGFWPALSGLPKAASPVLTIKYLGGDKAVISWPVGVTGFILEYTTDLGSGIWLPEPEAVTDTAIEHTVTVHTMPAFRCFRLRGQ